MKTLLFTGASGFLGSNILPFLTERYLVDTLDFSNSSTYTINLVEQVPVLNKKYDIVLHAAGKAHSVPKSKIEEQYFYDVNYQGTKNLCVGLEKQNSPHSLVFISTVAVYGCESGEQIAEDYPLNADTAYGKSKIQAEEYLKEWCDRKNVLLTILRPSLLAGKNPPGNLGVMIKGIANGKYVSIAGGKTIKSIAMANDIGRLVPYSEEKSGVFNLCDDYHPSFRELEGLISKQLNRPQPINVPLWSVRCLAKIGDAFGLTIINTDKLLKITNTLTFSNEKIKKTLNFTPSDVLSNLLIH